MTAEAQPMTGLEVLSAAWAEYGKASDGLREAYDAAIDAALVQLGKATCAGYADYDASVALAWEAWRSATAEARHLRDIAVSEALARMEAEAKAEVRAGLMSP